MEKHDLHHELPEFEKIHALIISYNHFRKLFDNYNELNHKVRGVETTGVFSQMMS
ncbi:MAG: hypothetical protein P8O07_08960 [Crocinitomicaceae bacterium]|nr:hypothetical protein [Crocinitomicaceae bacterium]